MRLTCPVIEDLLPIYHDDTCSPETSQQVRDHLETCPNCRKLLSVLEGEELIAVLREREEAQLRSLEEKWKEWKRDSLFRLLIVICFLLPILALVRVAMIWGLQPPFLP